MINIIIPFYKNRDTIKKLLLSLADQDYKKFDCTIVMDGPDAEADLQLCEYLESPEFKFKIYIERLRENMGASAARNFGAKISGENLMTDNRDSILFFLDADCYLYPGMLRECWTQLQDNPDISFVYGNYRLYDKKNPERKSLFYSQGFDARQLETMNYISTMSPIRRSAFEKVGGFNEELKYFQDWDLFYRVALSGLKGKYLNSEEFLFETTMPEKESISSSKGLTLSEKAQEFRKLHKIPNRKLVASTLGAPLQATARAEMLDADYAGKSKDSRREVYPVNYQFPDWKATYMTGCYNESPEQLEQHFNVIVGKPIFHFIGTDVFQMITSHSVQALKMFAEAFMTAGAKIFANSPRLVRELTECFLNPELLYTPLDNIDIFREKAPTPKKFTVAVYYSDTNPMHMLDNERSNMQLIKDVCASMPDINFKFFGGLAKFVEGNVEMCGKVPYEQMPDFISSCSMLLRSTKHDGFPQLPIQFILCGRQALVSCPDEELKYCKHLSFEDWMERGIGYEKAKNEIITKIYSMQKDPENNSLSAYAYYSDLLSVENFKKRVWEVVDED